MHSGKLRSHVGDLTDNLFSFIMEENPDVPMDVVYVLVGVVEIAMTLFATSQDVPMEIIWVDERDTLHMIENPFLSEDSMDDLLTIWEIPVTAKLHWGKEHIWNLNLEYGMRGLIS